MLAAGLLLGLGACGTEATPPLEAVESVFWEAQSWEVGGDTARLTIWADGRSEILVRFGMPHLRAEGRRALRPGWETLDGPGGARFRRPDPLPRVQARQLFAAAVRGGITHLRTERPY